MVYSEHAVTLAPPHDLATPILAQGPSSGSSRPCLRGVCSAGSSGGPCLISLPSSCRLPLVSCYAVTECEGDGLLALSYLTFFLCLIFDVCFGKDYLGGKKAETTLGKNTQVFDDVPCLSFLNKQPSTLASSPRNTPPWSWRRDLF